MRDSENMKILGHFVKMKFQYLLLIPPLFAGTVSGRMSFIDYSLQLIKKIWIVCGDLRTSFWYHVFDLFGNDQFNVFVAGTLFATFVWYWLIGSVYTFMDIYLRPGGVRKYKIQPGTNEPLEPVRLKQVIVQIVYNQTVVGIPTVCLGGILMLWRRPSPIREIPHFHWVFVQFVFSTFVEEIAYFYIHRLLHSKYLYRKYHKRHHEWTSPVAITAMYCHPVEQIFANMFPIFLGPFLLNAHVTTYLTWFALAVFFTLSEHSGYHLPFMTSSEYHDFHHFSTTNNFGFLGIMDSLYSTNKLFKKSVSSSRHFVLKSLKSARELVPDPVDKRAKSPIRVDIAGNTEEHCLILGWSTSSAVTAVNYHHRHKGLITTKTKYEAFIEAELETLAFGKRVKEQAPTEQVLIKWSKSIL